MHRIPVLAVVLMASTACNLPDGTPDTRANDTTVDQQTRERETAALEARLQELERQWDQARARLQQQTSEAATRMRMAVDDDLAEARQTIADMRTTTIENWWERQERQLGEAADDVQQDVRRFARRFTEPDLSDQVATSGATEWEARRDHLVRTLEARIRAMEQALADVDESRGARAELEGAREEVKGIRADVERLRNASQQDWWQVTRARAEDYLERLEAAITRLTEGNV